MTRTVWGAIWSVVRVLYVIFALTMGVLMVMARIEVSQGWVAIVFVTLVVWSVSLARTTRISPKHPRYSKRSDRFRAKKSLKH